jgi:hypothetical protein
MRGLQRGPEGAPAFAVMLHCSCCIVSIVHACISQEPQFYEETPAAID